MTKSEPYDAMLGAEAAGDPLAGRLLAAQRAIAALQVNSDARMRLHSRLMAICAVLKVPGADRVRGARRLDRLIADADQARGGNTGPRDDSQTGNLGPQA
jgi:hypothetical protein